MIVDCKRCGRAHKLTGEGTKQERMRRHRATIAHMRKWAA